jgi:flagellar biosynthesis protein FliQ
MATEWKIDSWFKKTCFVLGAIAGIYLILAFIVGVIIVIMAAITGVPIA